MTRRISGRNVKGGQVERVSILHSLVGFNTNRVLFPELIIAKAVAGSSFTIEYVVECMSVLQLRI